MSLRGFPHSEIPGSKLVCSSPGLIAAYRVLHRLLAPRHSPYALSSLTTSVYTMLIADCRSQNSRFKSDICALPPALRGLFLTLRPPRVRWIGVRKELPFAGYSVVKEPCRLQAFAERRRSIFQTRAQSQQPAPQPNVVENTGLEPVTSWLQTRRSPS